MGALLVLWATLSRLFGLEHLLVWHDEAFTLARVFGYTQQDIHAAIFSGQLLEASDLLRFQQPDPGHTWHDALRAFAEHPEHPPLYYLIGYLATQLPLAPVTAVRGVSALFGILLIPAVYWLMRELFGSGPVPWIAALLVACSPLQLLYAQEARQYALWMLMVVVSSAALVRALRCNRGMDWGLYALCMSLGFHSHLLFLLMAPIHALYVALTRMTGRTARHGLGLEGWRWAIAIGVALLSFTPWLWVVITRQHEVGDFTAWMQRPIGLIDIVAAWARHPVELFVDLTPRPEPWWMLLLPLIGWAIWRFARSAPRPGAWLLTLTLLAYLGIVLVPDLLFGGSRSLHPRYALPALLTIQLMLAWWIGTILTAAPASGSRRFGLASLGLLIGLGLLSQTAIQHAETWSSKQFSAGNREIARLANADERTLIVASDSGVGAGELISLAYHLSASVRILGEPRDTPLALPTGHARLIALTPSDTLRGLIERDRLLVPLASSWQWLDAIQRIPAHAIMTGRDRNESGPSNASAPAGAHSSPESTPVSMPQ